MHDHSHMHGHDHHHGHSHAPRVDPTNRRRVGLAAVLTGVFVIVEVIGGVISGSLALIADAGHMVTDFAALAMAWGGFVIAQRPPTWNYTFGFDRVSILAAFVNGLTLFLVAGWIVFEAFHRLTDPSEILAGPMLWIAIAGLIVNILVFTILMGADQDNLNVRGAVLHVLGDLLGSVAAVSAAIIIMLTGWVAADPILSTLVALLILRSAWGLVRQSGHILLEGAPNDLDRRKISQDLLVQIEGLTSVDTIHIWCVTPERPIITLEAYVEPDCCLESVSQEIEARLREKFEIKHVTVNVRRQRQVE